MIKMRRVACLLLISAMMTACGSGGGSSASSKSGSGASTGGDLSSNPDLSGARATLSWSAPTQREDGSTIAQEEIAGYQVYHLEDASGEMDVIDVPATATEYEIELAAGTHELGVAVVDVNGIKSTMSELQSVEVN